MAGTQTASTCKSPGHSTALRHCLCTSAGTTLDIDSLWDVLNELYDARSKWKMIGLGLRLRHSDLDAISGSLLECLQSSLSKWLKGIDPPPTWEALVAVLRSPVVGEEKKAQELEEKFCSGAPTLTNTSTPVQGTCIYMSLCANQHPFFPKDNLL